MRVSEVGGRAGESFTSPSVQADRIRSECERLGLELIEVFEELDVSGGKALVSRPGLSRAVAAVESGDADVIVAAYFDRLFRSLATQAEVVDRVERAGGQVLAVDVGQVTNGSAGQWLSGAMLGAVSEYVRRTAKERAGAGQARAVERGAVPWARIPLGYRRDDDGTLEIDPQTAELARQAFQMKADGASAMTIRKWLLENGVERSTGGVAKMFDSRVYLGEVNFGELHNRRAHEALIDKTLWDRASRRSAPRGPQPKSDRLLARLKIVRCGSCGNAMGTMKVNQRNGEVLPIYRCGSHNICPKHATIKAEIVEKYAIDVTLAALGDERGLDKLVAAAREARQALIDSQEDLDAALRTFAATGLDGEASAIERLAELRQRRDDAQRLLDQMGGSASSTITAEEDWPRLSFSEKRALIRRVINRVEVAPAGPRRRWDGGEQRLSHDLMPGLHRDGAIHLR